MSSSRLLLLLAFVAIVCCSYSVASETEATTFPLSTLLEHTAIASGAARWAPTPRTRLEKLQLAQIQRQPEWLGARVAQPLYHGVDAVGHSQDREGAKILHNDRAKEPQSNHFGDVAPQGPASTPFEPRRAPRGTCKGNCMKEDGTPIVPPPVTTPPPPAPLPAIVPEVPAKPDHLPFPEPPAPEYPLATPPMPDCGGMCDPDAKSPILARIPSPPLNDMDIATVGLEGTVLAKVMEKLRNREGWLRAQKLWLSKAVEAAATIRREIELAEFTKDAVASDLDDLKKAQDAISIKYRADKLKWAFKDKKITMEALRERLEALEHAKADVSNAIREAKDEVVILENTLGPPSQQVQISQSELEEPLKFLDDIMAEHNYNSYE